MNLKKQKEISGNIHLVIRDFYAGAKDEGETELIMLMKRCTKLFSIYIQGNHGRKQNLLSAAQRH